MTIKSVIVTGGAGCIGIEVCNQLLGRGLEVLLFDLPEQVMRARPGIDPRVKIHYGSVLDSSSLREAMTGRDAVVHLAARLGVKRTESNRLSCLEINVDGTKKVLDAVVAERVQKVVFASSSEVYGEPLTNPITESTPVYGKTVYAVSKLMGEELCRAYSQRYPWLKHVVLRFFNAYGLYQTAQFVIPRFVTQVLKDQAPVIYGDGTQVRSYCYAVDTAAGTVEALLSESAVNDTFNIGNSDRPVTLTELAQTIIQISGKQSQLSPLYQSDFSFTDRSVDREIHARFCDTSKAEGRLGFKARTSLEEGVGILLQSGAIFDRWESNEDLDLQNQPL